MFQLTLSCKRLLEAKDAAAYMHMDLWRGEEGRHEKEVEEHKMATSVRGKGPKRKPQGSNSREKGVCGSVGFQKDRWSLELSLE